MDQVKIGRFIADLRKQKGLTQEALGDILGVTNKTVSRWENGNYMPDIEMFQLLEQEFDVSINELLAGQRLSDEEFRKQADENVVAVAKESAFSVEERKMYWKRKWRKDHVILLVILTLIPIACIVVPLIIGEAYLIALAPIAAVVGYAYQNNRMMAYVEGKLYDR